MRQDIPDDATPTESQWGGPIGECEHGCNATGEVRSWRGKGFEAYERLVWKGA